MTLCFLVAYINNMNQLPKDPVMLLSTVNMKLRDEYPSLEELCLSLDIDRGELEKRLAAIGYEYVPAQNQFK